MGVRSDEVRGSVCILQIELWNCENCHVISASDSEDYYVRILPSVIDIFYSPCRQPSLVPENEHCMFT